MRSSRSLSRLGSILTVVTLVTALSACGSAHDVPIPVGSDVGGCDVDYPEWESSPYVLPFAPGTAWPVRLDNCSASFHAAGQPDDFAYDFDMPVGTEITAARAGTVSRVVADQPDFGGGAGNLVYIDHGDGTLGVYLHFTTDAVSVAVGDALDVGDVLGLSGASGRAGYPHLHFIVVESPGDFPYRGVPVTFSNTSANPRGPQQGDVAAALETP